MWRAAKDVILTVDSLIWRRKVAAIGVERLLAALFSGCKGDVGYGFCMVGRVVGLPVFGGRADSSMVWG